MNSIEELCEWLKTTKGITKIYLEDLVSYIPEYEQYLEDNEKGWTANHIQCDLCSHKWVAVYPADLERIECPECNNMVMFEKL
jgi:DNA-directed RNA polymerase subunit RPC12/RpoP